MRSPVRAFARWLLLAIALLPAGLAWGQGCSACRDNTAGSAPQVREALRKAIPILGIPAAALFVGILLLVTRSHPKDEE